MRTLTRRQALGVAAVVALVVAGLVYLLLTSETRTPEPDPSRVASVVVTCTEIGQFDTISPETVGPTDADIASAPAGYLSDPAQVIGRISQYALPADHHFPRQDVAVRASIFGPSPNMVMPRGTRATPSAPGRTPAIGGLAPPHVHVDVRCLAPTGSAPATAQTRRSSAF